MSKIGKIIIPYIMHEQYRDIKLPEACFIYSEASYGDTAFSLDEENGWWYADLDYIRDTYGQVDWKLYISFDESTYELTNGRYNCCDVSGDVIAGSSLNLDANTGTIYASRNNVYTADYIEVFLTFEKMNDDPGGGDSPITYTITYDANGGSGAPDSQVVSYGEWSRLSDEIPSKSGYEFKGWATRSDVTEPGYFPGEYYYIEENLYLYAIWEYIGGEDDSDFTFEINSENEVKITGYLGSGEHVIIPGEIQGLPVTEIGDDAFDNQSIASIKIPSSITKIGVGAFASCSKLKSLYIDDLESWLSVTLAALSSHPLYNQGGLLYINNELAENISIPDEIYEIKNAAFYNCDSLISVTIHKNVTSIGQMAFRRCNLLERMRFESKFVNIGDYAFYECYNLSTIYLFSDSSADEYFPRSDYTKIYLYLITYDATGGVFLGASKFEQIVVEEEIIHLIDEFPSKSGYEFKGWSRSSGSTEINYSPGNAYYVQDDLYLYAVWKKKESGGGDSPDFPMKKGKYRVLINGRPAKWKDNDGNYYYMYVTWED